MIEKPVVLITGADGLVGRTLIPKLIASGYKVNALSRKKNQLPYNPETENDLSYFYWDVKNEKIDLACVEGVSSVVHLAGENIGAKKWSARRKKEIMDSRVDSINLIYNLLRKIKTHQVKSVLSASATGYYADSTDNRVLYEDSPASPDFLGKVCVSWEAAVQQGGKDLGLRTVLFRKGVILAPNAGLITKLAPMVRKGLGVVMGSGKQWMPWVHIDDVCEAYLWALRQDNIVGVYNLVAPQQVTFSVFMRSFAEKFGKSIWLPSIPAFLLKAGMGSMSALVLANVRVSSSKLQRDGFSFRFDTLKKALDDFKFVN